MDLFLILEAYPAIARLPKPKIKLSITNIKFNDSFLVHCPLKNLISLQHTEMKFHFNQTLNVKCCHASFCKPDHMLISLKFAF